MRFPIKVVAAVGCLTQTSIAVSQPDYRSPMAARGVVETYYTALDRGAFRSAYELWAGNGRASGKSYAHFRDGFAATARTRVVTRTATGGDAGAGSIYVDVPVDIYATLKNGRRQHFQGRYTLRRVNDVDGATPAQLHWHIASASLHGIG